MWEIHVPRCTSTLLVLMMAGLVAAKDGNVGKKLDLSTVRAHEQQPNTTLPEYVSLEMLREHNASIASCVQKHGEFAEIDGHGGCYCREGYVLAESGACILKKGRKGGKGLLGFFKKKSEFDDILGMEPCKGAKDCAEKLQALHVAVEAQVQEWRTREAAIGGKIADINATFMTDRQLRDQRLAATNDWIKLMKEQNKIMVGQLKRYTEQDQDNRRLSRDMANMQSEKRSLEHEVYKLQEKKDKLQAELKVVQSGEDIAKCEEQIRKLRHGAKNRKQRTQSTQTQPAHDDGDSDWNSISVGGSNSIADSAMSEVMDDIDKLFDVINDHETAPPHTAQQGEGVRSR